jgi:hypothetical protein
MMNRLCHTPLDQPKDQIRLARVVPNNNTSVDCRLETFDVEDCPPYEALSYTWGSKSPALTISLNGKDFEIRENLWCFLKRISEGSILHRRAGIVGDEVLQSAYLWIDQICIDQSSSSEKSH